MSKYSTSHKYEKHPSKLGQYGFGIPSFCDTIAGYWVSLSKLIIMIRNYESLYNISYNANKRRLCELMCVSPQKVERALASYKLPWPYYLQLATHLNGPSFLHCYSDEHAEGLGFTQQSRSGSRSYIVADQKKRDVRGLLILTEIPQSPQMIVDSVLHLYGRFTEQSPASVPKLPPRNMRYGMLERANQGREDFAKGFSNFERKLAQCNCVKMTDFICTNSLIAKNKKKVYAPIVPDSNMGSIPPLSSKAINGLAQVFGITTPKWLRGNKLEYLGVPTMAETFSERACFPHEIPPANSQVSMFKTTDTYVVPATSMHFPLARALLPQSAQHSATTTERVSDAHVILRCYCRDFQPSRCASALSPLMNHDKYVR
jgi:hypothetical protein